MMWGVLCHVNLSWFLQDPEHLQDNSNQILTAIIQGMRKEEPSNNVKLAATNALLNSLEFTKANFDKEVQSRVVVPGPVLRDGTPQRGGTLNRNLNVSGCVCVSDGATLHHAGGV